MKSFFSYLAILLILTELKSQNTVLCRVSPDDNKTIQVKWYSPKLINTEGVVIYRKETGSADWKKISARPVIFKAYKIPDETFKQDKELKSYQELAASPANIKDLVLLAVLIKSFKSDAFSKYLGIRYDDTSFEPGKEYEYKITALVNGIENELGTSKSILASNYKPINSPKTIAARNGNKKVSFAWKPEPDRYFGVNIYRKTNDTGTYYKITKDPVILSKTKNSKGEEAYGEEFFVDGKLKPHTTYYYQFEALDFFGSPSLPSPALKVVLKDQDPPRSPDSVYNTLDGKKVTIRWKKKKKEEDLLGFNIYRTSKNDTDFTKINKEIVSLNDSLFLDHVSRFGSYMYAVSCVDRDSNEAVSNPFHVEAYDNESPLKPKNLTVQSDSGRLSLRWTKNEEEDLKGYLVYRTINKNSEDTYVKMTPEAVTENSFTDILPKNIKNKFLYKVVAVDQSLNKSPFSDFAVGRMPDVVSPNAPFLKTISANEKKQVIIEWLPNAEPDLAGYNIYQKNSSDSTLSLKKLNLKPIDRSFFRYTDRYAEEGNLYEYYLEAIDSSNNVSKRSNVLKFNLKVDEDESKIKISSFEASYHTKHKQVRLKWKLKNEANLRGSVVYKLKPGETTFSPISGTTEELGLSDEDVSEGAIYTYQLRVYDQKGDVYRSEKITLTIK